jgi:hypothetical protein
MFVVLDRVRLWILVTRNECGPGAVSAQELEAECGINYIKVTVY